MAESQSGSTDLLPNVYIFNNIHNNTGDVNLLIETFNKLKCIVKVIGNEKYSHLKKIVNNIVEADFTNFYYIVIIVLDNTNEYENIWTTTDRKDFFINGDLFTAIGANRTLKRKLRFGIMQSNRYFVDDSLKRRLIQKNPEIKFFPGNDVKFYATSPGCALNHNWKTNPTSPFISILCEEIERNELPNGSGLVPPQRPLRSVLNDVTERVDSITGERPAKETDCSDVLLGVATFF